MMDPTDLRILTLLEDGLPLVSEPFAEIGERLDLTSDEVLKRVQTMQKNGVIRRFRARINQRQVGISANALVAWRCKGKPSEIIAPILASFSSVTHCYERKAVPGRWEYSLYTVHHGHSQTAVEDEVQRVANIIGLTDYLILFSTEEFKRVPHVRIREKGRGK